MDEYQNTNILQEKIYFKLVNSLIANEGLTVVGDNDQSLHAKEKLKIEFSKINSEKVAEFEPTKKSSCFIGLFRQNQEILAKDLSISVRDLAE